MPDKLETTNVFQFMVIRAPNAPEPRVLERDYINDEDDLFSALSKSRIGPMIYGRVFCENHPPVRLRFQAPPTPESLVAALLETLAFVEPGCPHPEAGQLESLRARSYVTASGRFYILPDRLTDMQTPMVKTLISVLDVLRAPPLKADKTLDVEKLKSKLQDLFDGVPLREVGGTTGQLASVGIVAAKRELFDTLYLLYVLRRLVSVNLEHIIDGLRAVHVLQALAVEPALINNLADLQAYLSATPVIHPLFARLYRFREPFNTIRPLGIGDLKVVKQWLCGYKAGDFAHVENVLDGETKVRVHRRLEKTEELFSTSSEKQEETQRDTQSTDRFELKREAESVIKQDLAVNANAAVTYTYGGGMIVANVTAGMAYTRSQTDQSKAAHNFSREVLDKAVKRIQSRASEQRSTTKLFETEETNTHTLANPAGHGHISGIYRWLDKEYRAQLFNYGKRLMFEFIVPEPAAFFVEARLRAFEAQVELPRPPIVEPPAEVQLGFNASDIDRSGFNVLRLKYDLSEFHFPETHKTAVFKDQTAGRSYFEEHGMTLSRIWIPRSFTCDLQSKGYDITSLMIDGNVEWNNPGKPGLVPMPDHNLVAIAIQGVQVYLGDFTDPAFGGYHLYASRSITPEDLTLTERFTPYPLTTDAIEVVLGFQNVKNFALAISARLTLNARGLEDWQAKVYKRIVDIERVRIDELNRHAQQAYQAQLATYRNRLGELRTTAINELLQGQSDAFNRQLIGRELKRLCLSMLTKDFDASTADDVTTKIEAMGERQVTFSYRQLEVEERPNATAPVSVGVEFADLSKTIGYPAPELAASAVKARYIQFLEQAFDWQQMAYLFYPYFWATPPRWIDLMSRSDAGDANMSAFLQAGSCKVLLAVSPAYDDSVMHYLATGEPWEGGPSPVVGDPLFVPLYEELRRQQDDLDGATPEGESWKFTVPTSLVYLENSSTVLPKSVCDP